MTKFPEGFLWGVSTSAYQIDGAVNEDGRGESIWDQFTHMSGTVSDGSTGDVACDHYHRYPADIDLMAELGIRAYRFSISWPRILPNGTGEVNQAGIDYYNDLIDKLLEKGITPFPTLYHWELPTGLHGMEGWTHRDTAYAFAEFADVCSAAFGDRVKHWITHNEPWCASMLSHQLGMHAPGIRDWAKALMAAHHILLSHGLAVQAIRRNVPDAEIGAAPNYEPAYPADDSNGAREAARIWDGYFIRWFNDPLFGRGYPSDMVHHYKEEGYLPYGLNFVMDGDMATIAEPCDFVGINLYTRHYAKEDELLDVFPFPEHVPLEELTAMNWEIYPQALQDLLCRIWFEYRPKKIYITENGCSYLDHPDDNGRVDDGRRISFLEKHIRAAHNAIQCGVPLAGYFQWSFMDNFEWGHGYTQRFGIVYVDYETQQRYPKDSAFWYRDVIGRNGLEE
jgi:beta-glucosidase